MSSSRRPSSGDYVRLPFAEGRRKRRWVRALGVSVILVAIGALVWARMTQLSSGDDAALRSGAQALSQAVQGDRAAFETARQHFRRASKAVVVDGYPVFVMELTDQLERGQVNVTDERIRPVMEALQGGDLKRARTELMRLSERDRNRFAWLERLLDDMTDSTASDRDDVTTGKVDDGTPAE